MFLEDDSFFMLSRKLKKQNKTTEDETKVFTWVVFKHLASVFLNLSATKSG